MLLNCLKDVNECIWRHELVLLVVLTGAQPGYAGSNVAFPKSYVNFTAFVAEHGSLTEPTRPGFRVAAVRVTNGKGVSLSHVNFASGWLQDGVPWGKQLNSFAFTLACSS